MDKTSKKVTKYSKRQERGKKSHETNMKRLEEKIMEDNQPPTPSTSSPIGGPAPSTSSSTGDPTPSTPSHTTRSIMILMTIALVYFSPLVFVYFLHITLSLKNLSMIAWQLSMSKKRINHQNAVKGFRSEPI